MTKNNLLVLTLILMVAITGYFIFEQKNNGKSTFEKKQECSKYSELADKKIKQSGRVFEKDSYTLNEVFYSPQMDSCLYAYVIHTTSDPKEIYSIDDVFGGSVYTGGIAPDAENTFYQKIAELKK